PEPYRLSDADLLRPAAHITNTALHVGHPQLKVSTDPKEENVGHVWSLSAALARMASEGLAREATWMRLHDLVRRLLRVMADGDDDPTLLADEARRAVLEEAKEMTVAPGFERVTHAQ